MSTPPHPRPNDPRPNNRRFLELAARAGLRGFGRVEPNPMVGAVLVRDGVVLGIGHHRRFGGVHAERAAIDAARGNGHDLRGATLYVTLEPCAAPGRNPPCTGLVLDAGIAEVVYARSDPHPQKGGGAALLRDAGVTVRLCTDSPLASGLAEPFIKRTTTDQPWVIAKWAQTIDGRVATRSGESKWISGERARRRVHALRTRVDAILTGSGTVIADDPQLTPRNVTVVRRPVRVVADTDLDIPAHSALVRTARETPTCILCDRELLTASIAARVRGDLQDAGVRLIGVRASANGRGIDLRDALAALRREMNVSTVLVEAGPGLVGGLIDADLVDEAVVYIAPLLLGDELARAVAVGRVAESLSAARRLTLWRSKVVGGDVELTYRRDVPPRDHRTSPS
ncbi:MAG: bifunctional diaminohydroxyphosphoribosylaminopyrimidine deaminase/5-amino-6-(5-phosphoribosylamino)uracil reductase RibD [Planctomycetota bacterium]|nr:bifunctional diaminohydroxyphosphoribosylaminopyrimidine deaminase/5-amino-6-(5-phosphoribosylamino)uracil reductase RibD [Planctomycetota bacterium]